MKKRIFAGFAALIFALSATCAFADDTAGGTFGYDFDAMTLPVPVNVIVPASVTAYLNPYGTTVAFDRNTLKRDDNATGANRLELTGDVISPPYTIENVGSAPVKVYASVSGRALGNARLVTSTKDVSEWDGEQQTHDVNLWVTGGLNEEAVYTTSYNITNSISIDETGTTRTLIDYLDGSSKGYFKINGKVNKYAKGWSETDGVHINFALKIVPAGT